MPPELQKRGESFAEHNRLLTARLYRRRYKLVDTLAALAARTLGLGKVIQRKSTAENPQGPP